MGKLKEALLSDKDASPQSLDKLTYALKPFTAEIRADGWWICKTPFASQGEKPAWSGPYPTIEEGCLAIARHLATELANRHAVHIAAHNLKPGKPLHGLKPTTKLSQKGTSTH